MAERLKVLMGIESNIKSKRRQRKTGKKEIRVIMEVMRSWVLKEALRNGMRKGYW